MKTLVFLITKSEVGGAQRFVREQLTILAQAGGYRLYLVTNQPGWLTETAALDLTGVWTDRRIEQPTSPGYLLALRRYLRRVKADGVICNSAYAGLYGRLAGWSAGVPSVYVSHGWSSVYRGGRQARLLNAIERQLARLSAVVWCVSANDFNVARQRIGIPARKLMTLTNAIFALEPGGLAQPYARSDSFKLVTVCRMAPPKRIDLLIRAMAGLPECRLNIVGTGEQRTDLEALTQTLDLDNVQFWGEIPAFAAYANFHAFALISNSEGLPLSALEALAQGLPVVVSNVGGCPELVDDCGVVVENTVEAIRAGIEDCRLNHPHYARQARNHFTRHFDLHHRTPEYLAFYKNLLATFSK